MGNNLLFAHLIILLTLVKYPCAKFATKFSLAPE